MAKRTSVTVLSAVVRFAFAVGFPMLRDFTLPVVAFQNPAGTGGVVLLVAVHARVALHALTRISNVGHHALPVQTPAQREAFRAGPCET